jgi:Zn-dependent alcohol dehydrogenase
LPELVRLIEHGHLNTSVLVSRRRSLEEVNDAIADLQDSTQIVRSVITFE